LDHSIDRWNDKTAMAAQGGSARHHRHPARAFAKLPEGVALEDASAMFRALGDPARLRLLARLVDGEICVTELADLEKEKISTVSARLRALYAVRLVKRRRQAKHIFYGLADAHVFELVHSALDHVTERR
jgi:ArsR family transcriptional regulator, lead/cadmium/zinc/bismuth-responsive transcriptional repressor